MLLGNGGWIDRDLPCGSFPRPVGCGRALSGCEPDHLRLCWEFSVETVFGLVEFLGLLLMEDGYLVVLLQCCGDDLFGLGSFLEVQFLPGGLCLKLKHV